MKDRKTVRALVVGLIVGALAVVALQRHTQNALNACEIDRAGLVEQLNAF